MRDPVDIISQKIQESQSIAITSHLRPDGDSICTGLALYFMGKSLDKNVALINKDNTPNPFNNFPDLIIWSNFDCFIPAKVSDEIIR